MRSGESPWHPGGEDFTPSFAFLPTIRTIVAAAGLTEAFKGEDSFRARIAQPKLPDLIIASWCDPAEGFGYRHIAVVQEHPSASVRISCTTSP